MNTERALEYLEFVVADKFVAAVKARLRTMTDNEVNEIWLHTHTDYMMGDWVKAETAALMPVIDREAETRRFIQMFPDLGPAVAPELYRKGGAYDLPF